MFIHKCSSCNNKDFKLLESTVEEKIYSFAMCTYCHRQYSLELHHNDGLFLLHKEILP